MAGAGGGKTQGAVTRGGPLRSYQEVIVGSRSLGRTLYYEICLWLGSVPGALGLVLRKLFWPRLFGSCGPGALFGGGVVLRHPHRIHLGARVVIGEGCVLDARHDDETRVLVLDDDVILAPHVVLKGRGARIRIGARSGLGPQTVIVATDANDVTVGADVAIGPQCSLIGGGEYNTDRLDVAIWRQGIKPDRPVVLDDDIWLGSHVTVVGGVRMARGSIAAAGAVITRPVEPYTICGGVPARVLRRRTPAGPPPPTGAQPDAA